MPINLKVNNFSIFLLHSEETEKKKIIDLLFQKLLKESLALIVIVLLLIIYIYNDICVHMHTCVRYGLFNQNYLINYI